MLCNIAEQEYIFQDTPFNMCQYFYPLSLVDKNLKVLEEGTWCGKLRVRFLYAGDLVLMVVIKLLPLVLHESVFS